MTPAARKPPAAQADVDAFLAALAHPHMPAILALRAIILASDPAITEGIKWNAPSFRTTEWFATFHLRAKEGVQLILHLGARARQDVNPREAIDDPAALLEWLARDRASLRVRDAKEVAAKRGALRALIREWIRHV